MLAFIYLLAYLKLFSPQPELEKHQLGGNIIVSVPKAARERPYPVVLVFGGSDYASPQFMWEQTPDVYFQEAIMIYAPCYVRGGFGFRPIMERVRYFLKDQTLYIKHISVCGFSSGGSDALLANPYEFKAIGLIDPVPVTEGSPIRPHHNTILSFYRQNWKYSESYGEAVQYRHFEELAHKIKQAGGLVEEPKIEHKAYPKYFFERFKGLLLGE